MNLLILSPGRRVEIVKYFRAALNKDDRKVICLDMVETAPALYVADKYYIINKDFKQLDVYISEVLTIALKENVSHIISLIDPELELLAKNRKMFKDKGIELILSENNIIDCTFDKFKFYQVFNNDIKLVKTFNNRIDTLKALESNQINFPLIVKHRKGSASSGIQKLNNLSEFESLIDNDICIFQEFIQGKEYGVDAYFDLITGEITSVFIKEKISMRAGETDKANSVFINDIWLEIKKFEKFTGFRGPADFDVFVSNNGEMFINEINPRFGGGYPHAYNCGVNFMELILNNMKGIKNQVKIGSYPENILMMKYNGLLFKNGTDINFT